MTKTDAQEDPKKDSPKVKYVKVKDLRPEGYDGSCLRPLGMCDLGSCDVCWHNPEHKRFQDK